MDMVLEREVLTFLVNVYDKKSKVVLVDELERNYDFEQHAHHFLGDKVVVSRAKDHYRKEITWRMHHEPRLRRLLAPYDWDVAAILIN